MARHGGGLDRYQAFGKAEQIASWLSARAPNPVHRVSCGFGQQTDLVPCKSVSRPAHHTLVPIRALPDLKKPMMDGWMSGWLLTATMVLQVHTHEL